MPLSGALDRFCRRKLVSRAALATAILAAGTSIPLSVGASNAAPTSCAPVALLAFRGSGENSSDDVKSRELAGGQRTNGYEGKVLGRLATQFYSDHPEMADVPFLTVPGPKYPAVAVDQGKEALSPTLAQSPVYVSSEQGAAEGLAQMGRFRFRDSRGCASTRFILLGYSQGAMAARSAALTLPNAVAATFFYGDPWHKAGAPENIGDGRGNGIFRINYFGAGGIVDQFDKISGIPKRSNCHGQDVICSPGIVAGWNGLRGDSTTHQNYFDIPGEAKSEAGKVADVVRPYLGTTTPPTASKASAAVAIAIDTTGSMGSYIEQAKSNAIQIANNILSGNPASRVALVEYKDLGDPFVARTVVPATRDSAQFSAGVQGLFASGGGDTPESVYSGLVEALRDVKDVASDLKSVIVIGDAPPHDPEPGTGYTGSQVGRFFTGIDPVPSAGAGARSLRSLAPTSTDNAAGTRDQPAGRRSASAPVRSPSRPFSLGPTSAAEPVDGVSLYTLSASPDLSNFLRPISDETGGKVLDVSDSTSVISAIDEAVSDATSAPVARIAASPFAFANSDIPISAAGSSGGAGLTFAFDLTGTGVFGASGESTETVARFPVPGSYKVSVRVTDSRGRTSTASTVIEVKAPETAPNSGRVASGGTGSMMGPLFGSS